MDLQLAQINSNVYLLQLSPWDQSTVLYLWSSSTTRHLQLQDLHANLWLLVPRYPPRWKTMRSTPWTRTMLTMSISSPVHQEWEELPSTNPTILLWMDKDPPVWPLLPPAWNCWRRLLSLLLQEIYKISPHEVQPAGIWLLHLWRLATILRPLLPPRLQDWWLATTSTPRQTTKQTPWLSERSTRLHQLRIPYQWETPHWPPLCMPVVLRKHRQVHQVQPEDHHGQLADLLQGQPRYPPWKSCMHPLGHLSCIISPHCHWHHWWQSPSSTFSTAPYKLFRWICRCHTFSTSTSTEISQLHCGRAHQLHQQLIPLPGDPYTNNDLKNLSAVCTCFTDLAYWFQRRPRDKSQIQIPNDSLNLIWTEIALSKRRPRGAVARTFLSRSST